MNARNVDSPSSPLWRRVLFWSLVASSLGSVAWVKYTPFLQKPIVGFALLALAWLTWAAVPGRRRHGIAPVAFAGAATVGLASFAVVTSLMTGPLWVPTFTAAPVDIDLIVDMSRYRSCAGHDYSGARVGAPGATESDRSMKHYVTLSTRYGDGVEVAVYAMTDGVVTDVIDSQESSAESTLGFQGNFSGEMTVTSTGAVQSGTWSMRYFHVHPVVSEGTRVKAGDRIAVVPPSDWSKVTERDGTPALPAGHPVGFDIALGFHPLLPTGEQLASFTDYLSDDLAARFEAAGYALEDLVIARDVRDSAPCNGEYNVDAAADWVNSDEVRRAADAQAGGGGESSSSNGAYTGSGNRPECTEAAVGSVFTESDGTKWKCQRTAEGRIAWGPV